MKLFTGSLAAGLVLLAGSAQAQVPGPYENGRPPYTAASDFDAAAAPQPVPGPNYGPGPRYGNSPSLLPSTEVYSVLRDNGFSPLGIPRLRGFVYTIAAIDRGGADGRLIIDARNGRIIRFLPAYRMGGDNYYEEQSALHGPFGAQPPQVMARPPQAQAPDQVQAEPRPSRPAHVASRTVPMPKASPIAAKPAPAPVQQATAPAPKSAEVQAAAPVTTGSAPAKPVPSIAPTQDMPTAQGLE